MNSAKEQEHSYRRRLVAMSFPSNYSKMSLLTALTDVETISFEKSTSSETLSQSELSSKSMPMFAGPLSEEVFRTF